MDKCYICGKEKHSISTWQKPIGDYSLCRECGDLVEGVIVKFANKFITDVEIYVKSGTTPEYAVDILRQINNISPNNKT